MPKAKPRTIDLAQADAVQQILPCSPVLSSHTAAWKGIHLEYHCQPAHETPEYCFPGHTISIGLRYKAKEFKANGRLYKDFAPGNIGIIPANQNTTTQAYGNAEFILLSITPGFLNRAAHETLNINELEIVPQIFGRDPLIYQLGLELKKELEFARDDSHLYAESMATALAVHLMRRYAGFVPLDLCADAGGSTRIPAHFCGVFGIKPTEHRVSMAGAWIAPLEGNAGLQYMYAAGAVTRSVADLKLWLSIVEGEDERWNYVPPAPKEAVEDRPLETYRIAWTDTFDTISASIETQTLIEKLAQTLVEQGCHVEKASPSSFNFTTAWENYGELMGAWFATRPIPTQPTFTNNLRKLIAGGPIIKGARRGMRLNLKQYAAALARRATFTQEMDKFLSQWDAWICPVVAFPAFKHQPVAKPIDVDGKAMPYLLGGAAYTCIFTLTGHPVVVIPIGQTRTGLPIGIHLVGHRWRDYQLLNLAQKITEVTGAIAYSPG